MLWILIGWQFTLAEYVGGVVLVALMTVLLRLFVSPRLEVVARRHAQAAESKHDHHRHHGGGAGGAWADVAGYFRADWRMLWKEIAIGFLLAGFIGLLGNDAFNSLFVSDAPAPLPLLENVVVGPLIAVLSFVCSIGNVPLAAVLWSGGISFAGVIAFIFADLVVLPIVVAYRKYYGWPFTARITALMLVTMVIAALIVDGIFSGLGLIPHARPSRHPNTQCWRSPMSDDPRRWPKNWGTAATWRIRPREWTGWPRCAVNCWRRACPRRSGATSR